MIRTILLSIFMFLLLVTSTVALDSKESTIEYEELRLEDIPTELRAEIIETTKNTIARNEYVELDFIKSSRHSFQTKDFYMKERMVYVNPKSVDFSVGNVTVSMKTTATNGTTWQIMSVPYFTDNRTEVRRNGTIIGFVDTGEDGYATYKTDSFSTQILAIPDFYLEHNDGDALIINNYFSGYTEDEIFIFKIDLHPGVGNVPISAWDFCSFSTCKLEKDAATIETDVMTIRHHSVLGNDVFSFTSKTTDFTQEFGIAVNDGSTFIGEDFNVIITSTDAPEQITSIAPISLEGEEYYSFWDDGVFINHNRIAIQGYDPIADTSFTLNRTFSQSTQTYDGAGFRVRLIPYGSYILIDFLAKNQNVAQQTFTITAYGETPPPASTTFTFETSTGITSTPEDLTDGLISYYTFDEISGTTSTSEVGSNPITWNNARVLTSENQGIIDTAADFTQGDDYGIFTTSLNYNHNTPFSVGFWFKTSQIENNLWFIARDGGYDNQHQWGLGIRTDGIIRAYVGGSTNHLISNTNWINNQWNFLVMTYDGTNNPQVYINGEFEGFGDRGTGTFSTDTYIGRRTGSFGYASFEMDELFFYNRPLSSAEITQLYNEGNGLQYPFEETEPPTQTASIPNQNRGFEESFTLNYNTYFTDFTSMFFSFTDPDTSSLVNFTTSNTYDTSFGTFSLNTIFEAMSITTKTSVINIPITMGVCNAAGCIQDTFTLNVGSPLSITNNFPDILLGLNSDTTINPSNYFSGFQSVEILFEDSFELITRIVSTGSTFSNLNKFIQVASDNMITFESKSNEFTKPMSIRAYYGNTFLEQNFTMIVEGTLQQIGSLANIVATHPENVSLDISNWFINFDMVEIYLHEKDVTLVSGITYNYDEFTIYEVLNTLYIETNDYAYTTDITITVSKGEDSLSSTFTYQQLGAPPPPPPLPPEEAVENWILDNWKLVFAIIIILTGAIIGAMLTNGSAFVAMIGGFLGLVISTAGGFVGSGWVILILMFMIIMVVLKSMMASSSGGE